jgi:hypothetical protein
MILLCYCCMAFPGVSQDCTCQRNRTAEVRGSNPLGSTKSSLPQCDDRGPNQRRQNQPRRRGSAIYCPATISNGDTQVTGSATLLHLGQVSTWVPVRRLPSPERQSETFICHALTQDRPGLQ